MSAAIETLIESIFGSYPYMKLHQRIIVLTALAQALEPDEEKRKAALDAIPEALELEIVVSSLEEMYRHGEIPEIRLPDDAKKLYELEIKLLTKVFSFFIRPKRRRGPEKYL